MIVAESRRSRRLVGRLDKGADVIEGLAEVCRVHHVRAGEVRALGSLEQVVVSEYDQRARAYRPQRRFDAQFDLLALHANLSEKDGKLYVHARVTLSRERDNGIELIGGQLVSARAFQLEFVIDAFDDLILRRAPDAATGLSLWREAITIPPAEGESPVEAPDKQAPPPFEAPARTEWKDVMKASERHQPAEPEVEPTPEAQPQSDARIGPGDYIDHPKFGRCQVERIEGDYEFVSARLKNQRLIRLSLDVLTLILVGREGEHQLFRAQPGSQ
jgi:predicted DNA-binding protein with PD1-like motif